MLETLEARAMLIPLMHSKDWQEGHGGELRLHAGDTRPDPRREDMSFIVSSLELSLSLSLSLSL